MFGNDYATSTARCSIVMSTSFEETLTAFLGRHAAALRKCVFEVRIWDLLRAAQFLKLSLRLQEDNWAVDQDDYQKVYIDDNLELFNRLLTRIIYGSVVED